MGIINKIEELIYNKNNKISKISLNIIHEYFEI